MRTRSLPPDPSRAHRTSAPDDWQDTLPGGLAAPPVKVRPQPPLTEVLHGLDARELEGATVFDQFFGLPLPAPR